MPTTNPVPSSDPSDLVFNAEKMDQVVNSAAETFTDRLGTVRKTINGVMIPLQDAATEAIDTDIPALVGDVQAARNTAVNVDIPAAVALVDTAVAVTAAGSASAAAVRAEAARDSALINSGKYATTAAALSDSGLAANAYFLVAGLGNNAASEYQKKSSVNLFNTATVRDGKNLDSGTGAVHSLAGWGISAFIPITAGQQYTISGTRGRHGLSFFTAASDAAVVAGSYNGTTTLPLTVTAPSGATHMVIALYSATATTYANVQVEMGASATTYAPYDGYFAVAVVDYPSTAYVAGVASDLSTLQSSVNLIDEQVMTYVAAKNMYNAAEKLVGKYIETGTGKIVADAAWAMSGPISVTPGQKYTISAGAEKRSGLAFYATNETAIGTLPVSGTFDATGTLPYTVTAPAGAAYLMFNIKSNAVAEPASIQVEAGASATAYEAWHVPYLRADKSSIYPAVSEVQNMAAYGVLSLDTTTPANNYVEATQSGHVFRHGFTPFTGITHSVSNVFNFLESTYDGITLHSTYDDAAPYRLFGTTLGASHGYAQTYCTMAGHGKTAVDVGSVYRDSSLVEWVITGSISSSVVAVTARASNAAFPGGTLTHVSGGTNTANIVTTSVSAQQWYPVNKNRAINFVVDGLPVAASTASYKYRDKAVINERYELMNKSSIVAWLIANVGSITPTTPLQGTADVSVSISYQFDVSGNCTIYTDFLALNAVSSFLDIMFVMSASMRTGFGLGNIKYYVPKSLPFTHESVGYDFTQLTDMTTWAPATRADFTPARCEPAGILCDRAVEFNDAVGFALGYLPVQDAEITTRRARAVRKALQIAETKKIYMSCIDLASKSTLSPGDYFSAVAYRNYFVRPSARTTQYVVEANDGSYLYLDWHVTAVDRVDLPAKLQGKAFTVVEKSANVTPLSAYATNSLAFSVAAAGGYGYAVLKFG